MRTFLVLICSLALACAAGGAQEENESKKPAPKKQTVRASSNTGQNSDLDLRGPQGGSALDKPTFGEKFMMGLKKFGSAPVGIAPTPVVRGQGKLEGRQATGAGKAKARGKPTEDATPGLYGTSDLSQRAYAKGRKPAKPTPTEAFKSAGGKKKSAKVSPTPRPR